MNPGFDDSAFNTGGAAFGSGGGCPLQPQTNIAWPANTEVLLRRNVTVPVGTASLTIATVIDNDVEVFWNGQQIGSNTRDGCPSRDDFLYTLANPASGDNLLAVRGIDRGIESFLDVEVTATLP
jgi:hypothetical protein